MLDRYEKAIINELVDIIETEDLRKAPAGRTVEIDESHAFSVVAKLYDEEIVLSWFDDKQMEPVFITINTKWKKDWAMVVNVFAVAMRSVVEN